MTLQTSTETLLQAARGGDETAFQELVAPHLRALHLHGYRMLGSYHDAEEALQETLLRAWQGLPRYESRAPLRHWLYRITTTTCLKMINRRARSVVDAGWLQPYPDRLLDQLGDADADPAVIVDQRESVALAFIAAVQLLPGTQRAVLILREVLGWPAQQVADLLGTSVAGVNSALQRARATLAHAHGSAAPPTRPGSDQERRVVAEFVRAWHERDIPALAALLRDDAILTMPPQAVKITGRDAVIEFFATVPADGRLDLIRLVEIRANGQPAVAAYLPDEHSGDCRGYGIMVLTLDADQVAAITGFPEPALFPAFALSTVR
ncbi:RNA polymerase subunit sigma-70 [Paractinoplanes brasiliensis]|uniref:RNA polymerase ECF family sigma subunit n=1 Tax=Paractinoplanes brasiliensis TaxID=52695 RepID=A0A4R6J9U7_9ACTN|nr:RNA polymerase subunit sigma-70 [Actinoplanes brasiliensis]TDO32262.1 RNA polymerase ECF family sigma subunit [Actinoplanes brasiliensis]GID27869.1 RNA polymerase sigma factor [Actinoplanes brasiliensis]